MTLHDTIRSWIGTDLQQPNWDSYGARPITDSTIAAGILIAERLDGLVLNGRLICVGPTNDGGIEFSDGDEDVYLRLTVVEDATC